MNGIVSDWESTFAKGVPTANYIGDILDSLGGTPDFGLPSMYLSEQTVVKRQAVKKPRGKWKRGRRGARMGGGRTLDG